MGHVDSFSVGALDEPDPGFLRRQRLQVERGAPQGGLDSEPGPGVPGRSVPEVFERIRDQAAVLHVDRARDQGVTFLARGSLPALPLLACPRRDGNPRRKSAKIGHYRLGRRLHHGPGFRCGPSGTHGTVDTVIVRIWEAQIVPGRVHEFSALFASTILPKLMEADGCLGGEVLQPIAAEQNEPEIIGITRWRDEESLRALLGPRWWLRPMWEEEELEYLASPPRVRHFVPVEPP
jgi:hypothetical protein